jgi:uncharacterized DUF497 family protein
MEEGLAETRSAQGREGVGTEAHLAASPPRRPRRGTARPIPASRARFAGSLTRNHFGIYLIVMPEFRWIPWNVEKCELHGIRPWDAEFVVRFAHSPYPRRIDDEKLLAWGRTASGQYLQVIFLIQEDDTLFVIHARPLTPREKQRYRRRSP